MEWISEERSILIEKEVEVLPNPSTPNLDSIVVAPVEQAVIVSLKSPLTGDRRSASEMCTLTGPVTHTDTLSGTERPDGRESLLGGCATGLGVTIDSQVYTPPAAPPDIPTYEEVRQAYDDGSPYGNIKGIVEAMQFARFMADEHGVLIAELPRSQQSTLTRLIAERQGITLPTPKRIKRGRPWRRPEKPAEAREAAAGC